MAALGDGTVGGSGNISFGNSGTIYQPVLISNSGGTSTTIYNTGVIGTSVAASSAPIFTIGGSGDGSGSGAGSISFGNVSTGTIYQPVTISNSGGSTLVYNTGTIGASGPVSSAPIFTISGQGDGSGEGAGSVSFGNVSTGTILQPVAIVTSGGNTTVYNSGTLGATGPVSSAPIFTISGQGDGAVGGSGNISFGNVGTIYQPVVISNSGGTSTTIYNGGSLGAAGPVSHAPDLHHWRNWRRFRHRCGQHQLWKREHGNHLSAGCPQQQRRQHNGL